MSTFELKGKDPGTVYRVPEESEEAGKSPGRLAKKLSRIRTFTITLIFDI